MHRLPGDVRPLSRPPLEVLPFMANAHGPDDWMVHAFEGILDRKPQLTGLPPVFDMKQHLQKVLDSDADRFFMRARKNANTTASPDGMGRRHRVSRNDAGRGPAHRMGARAGSAIVEKLDQ